MTKEDILLALERAIVMIRASSDVDTDIDPEVEAQTIAKAFEAIRDYIESDEPSKKPKRQTAQKPKDWAELWQYVVRELGLTDNDARYLWNNWKANGFTRLGKPILDWKAAARAWKAAHFYPSQKQK